MTTDTLDLTADIATAIDGAALTGHPVAIAYVDDDARPSLSLRGSIQVHGPQQIAIWARSAVNGLAAAITDRPHVSLLYYGPDSPGPKYLSIQGRARVDSSANDQVYATMVQGERDQDPEAKGVALIVDVDSVIGLGDDGPFSWSRD